MMSVSTLIKKPTSYAYESDLVNDFLNGIFQDSPFGSLITALEFYYGAGKTDVIGLSEQGNILAFEAKLTQWKKALEQGYRNTTFASLSFIVLPIRIAQKAAQFEYEFSRRNVGLCAVDSGIISVLIWPELAEPISPWISKEALSYVQEENGFDVNNIGRYSTTGMCATLA